MAKVEQTSNGSRVRLSRREWLTIFMFIAPILFGGVLFYANTNNGIEALAKADTEHEKVIKEVQADSAEQGTGITKLETRFINMEKDVENVQAVQQENQKILYKILGVLESP